MKAEQLWQINYLAQKVNVLFNFPSRSHCTCNRTYGKTRYTYVYVLSIWVQVTCKDVWYETL